MTPPATKPTLSLESSCAVIADVVGVGAGNVVAAVVANDEDGNVESFFVFLGRVKVEGESKG